MWSNSPSERRKDVSQSAFQQQRLPAWQPLLTPQSVIGTFLCISIVFIPIGIAILAASNNVVELEYRYTDVKQCNVLINTVTGSRTVLPSDMFPQSNYNTPSLSNCFQQYDIQLDQTMNAPIFFYYKLSNYYQNHRRYVKSRSDYQLRGDSNPDLSGCTPMEKDSNGNILYPCGLIANSFFNDTFGAALLSSTGTPVSVNTSIRYILGNNTAAMDGADFQPNPSWNKQGISWHSDRNTKFQINAEYAANVQNTAATQFTNISPLGEYHLPNVTDEDFIVWMRTAGLPTFKKLYRKIEDVDLPAGSWLRVTVNNVYNVDSFGGTKSFVLSTTSWIGGKNDFLGIAYVVVGVICLLLGLLFACKHCFRPRTLGSMQYFQQKQLRE